MPNFIDASMRGNSVKKTLLVLVTAMVLVFAFSASAMANVASGTYPWDPAAPNNNPATPHKGYAYNTEKCLVCHAVHKASATGQVLLGETVGNACNYCHVSTNTFSSKHVYNNDPANFAADTVFNHSNKCTACHAVHGAGTVNQPDLSAKILKDPTSSVALFQIESLPANWDVTSSGTDRAGALSAFCAGCHPYYTGTYADSDADGNVKGSSGVGGPYNSHIMTSDFASYDSANGATVSGQPVAYASSAYCTSCHDSGAGTVADNFPHLTSGARFMKSSDYVNDTATPAVSATEDGVCLKCHVGTNGTVGVGIGF